MTRRQQLLMDQVEILDRMRDLLSDETKWTTGRLARNEDNWSVPEVSEEATQFCIIGALRRCGPTKGPDWLDRIEGQVYYLLTDEARRYSSRRVSGLATFNDFAHTTFADIRNVIARARATLIRQARPTFLEIVYSGLRGWFRP